MVVFAVRVNHKAIDQVTKILNKKCLSPKWIMTPKLSDVWYARAKRENREFKQEKHKCQHIYNLTGKRTTFEHSHPNCGTPRYLRHTQNCTIRQPLWPHSAYGTSVWKRDYAYKCVSMILPRDTGNAKCRLCAREAGQEIML